MSIYLACAAETADLDLRQTFFQALNAIGERRRVLVIPPDFSRYHSRAGELTELAWQFYGHRLMAVLPALGTHSAMPANVREKMFGAAPASLFRVHDWRSDVVTLGDVPAAFIEEQSEGQLHYSWPAQVNRLLVDGGFDLILSIGQVVPHEVAGMANYNKNVLIGTGGPLSIHRSHFLGAVYGMERIMGRADNPVRRLLNYAADRFARDLPIVYALTVIGSGEGGRLATRGLFVGDDIHCFEQAAALSARVNIKLVERPIQKAVVFLDRDEFHSTWLGNKAIYRTRMALADDAELIVLAPGVREFGEDAGIDRLIRRHGYRGTPATLAAVAADDELAECLGAAAHLIHGSSEGRFTITYCPGGLTKEEVEGVGFRYAPLAETMAEYDPAKLTDGLNRVKGEEIFFISHPGLGLWAHGDRFDRQRD